MRLVRNPSYKHSKEVLERFDKLKAYIYYKDHTQYHGEDIEKIMKIASFARREFKFKADTIRWYTKVLIDDYEEKQKQYSKFYREDSVEADSFNFGVFEYYSLRDVDEDDPILREDYLMVLQEYERNKKRLPDIFTFKNIAELSNSIENLAQEGLIVSDKTLDVFFEIDGWFISMPHTTDASCFLGKQTSWCTARTVSQNLFLSYVARENENIILFYVIKIDGNPLTNPNDKLSVGFVDCKPDFRDREMTVNAANQPINKDRFISIVGEDKYEKMIEAMAKKCNIVGGKHPAKKEMERLVQNRELFREKLCTFKSKKNKDEFLIQAAKYKKVSSGVATEILLSTSRGKDPEFNHELFRDLASNSKFTEEEAVEIIENYEELSTINFFLFIKNKNLSKNSMMHIIKQQSRYVYALGANQSISGDVVRAIIDYYKADNKHTIDMLILNLSENQSINEEVIEEVLEYIHTLKKSEVISLVARIKRTTHRGVENSKLLEAIYTGE